MSKFRLFIAAAAVAATVGSLTPAPADSQMGVCDSTMGCRGGDVKCADGTIRQADKTEIDFTCYTRG